MRYILKVVFGLYKSILLVFLILGFNSCEKGWLTEKRDLNTVLPTDLKDLEAILNIDSGPSLANDLIGSVLVSCDDYYTTGSLLNVAGQTEYGLYTWTNDIFPISKVVTEWNGSYEQVFYANVVLDKLPDISRTDANRDQWNAVRGGALFFRAKAFYNIAQQFAPPYEADRAGNMPGIPLRLSSDPNPPTERSSLSETYGQIIGDLQEAAHFLGTSPESSISASKPAAYALLARIFLSMGEYREAGLYADSCLGLKNELLDYNTLAPGSNTSYPIPPYNREIILHGLLLPNYYTTTGSVTGFVDTVLFQSYADHDLRKVLFFRTEGSFRGNYTGSISRFGGIATDEVWLIRAECHARAGNEQRALQDLNWLLKHRYDKNTFEAPVNIAGDELLSLILVERRKQLLYRGLRWGDLRRLNREPGRETNLVRVIDGQRTELQPGSPRYTLPIPDAIIRASGIPQNLY